MEQDHSNGAAEPSTDELPGANLAVIDAKLNVVISKVALLERDEETVFDRLDELRKGQLDIVNGQKHILNTLTNEVLAMNKTVKDQTAPAKHVRYLLAFTGGMVGGLAGGAMMVVLLKLGALTQNPAALTLLDLIRP